MKSLSDIGERKAIKLISDILSKGEEVIGIGDDCAAFQFNDDLLLVSTDMITEDTHIPKNMTPWQMGWFIVAINVSDIAAKGGRPFGFVLSLGLPKDKTDSFLKEIIKGADKCAKQFGFSIVGGDTKENRNITLNGTIFGYVKKDRFMPRKGCRPGDVVVVTGELGKAGAGYYALKDNLIDEKIIKGLLEPFPRVDEGIALAGKNIVTSCMDISDGLSSSLYQLMEVNDVGFEIDKEKIPLSSSLQKLSKTQQLDVFDYALHFGGDYELLFTVPYDKFQKAGICVDCIGGMITEIGRVTKEKKVNLIDNQRKITLENKGYEHFNRSKFL